MYSTVKKPGLVGYLMALKPAAIMTLVIQIC
jgi:hypothetical protein